MKSTIVGIAILIVIVTGALLYQFVLRDDASSGGVLNRQSEEILGLIGSEKSNFLENPEVQDILRREYNLVVDYRKAGSIEMIDMDHSGMDFLWPSSSVALELYTLRHGSGQKNEAIFASPIVFYSWDKVVDSLVAGGVAVRGADDQYEADVETLVRMVLENTPWSDLGLDELWGGVTITSTDPTRSNSGNLFSGLVANILYGGVVDEAHIDSVLPETLEVFRVQGYMQHSTGTLFERYLEQRMGSFPIILGYENQIVEYRLQNPEAWAQNRNELRILYPVPTVFSEHPLIALTDGGERLIEALQDEEIMRIAWEQHGFRTGPENDPQALGVDGIPRSVTRIVRMPVPAVMERIIAELGG